MFVLNVSDAARCKQKMLSAERSLSVYYNFVPQVYMSQLEKQMRLTKMNDC